MNDKTTFNFDGESDSSAQSEAIGKLILQAGRGATPPNAATEKVYRAVHDAWQAEHTHRQWRGWQRSVAIAATVLLTVAISFWAVRSNTGSNPAGVVAEIHGSVVRVDGSGQESPVTTGATLSNEELHTMSGSNVLLRRSTGLTVLLGPNTRVHWEARDALRLLSGILYIDSGRGKQRDELAVLTRAGRIQHMGTQFTVDARAAQIRVAVRQGVVRVNTLKGETRLSDGNEAKITESGELERQNPAGSDAWTWLPANDPQFAIENRSLAEVVRDIADASGVRVRFATPEIERLASQLILHGPALKLEPLAALDAVLLTTQLRANRDTRDSNLVQITLQQ